MNKKLIAVSMILLFGLMMGSAFAYDDDQENDFFGGLFGFFASFFESIAKVFSVLNVTEETGTGYDYGADDDSSATSGNLANDAIGVPGPEPTEPETPEDSLTGSKYPTKENPKTCYDYCYNYYGNYSWREKFGGEFDQARFEEGVKRCERVRGDSLANCYDYRMVKCLDKTFEACHAKCISDCALTGESHGSDWACTVTTTCACASHCRTDCEGKDNY